MVIEINKMKWIRGIPCRCQSVKLSQIVKFDLIDFSCDESKENNLIKTILSYKTLMQ